MKDTAEKRAARIQLLLIDVDGVLTDGRIVYGPGETEWKFFDVKDGHGIKLTQRAGIQVGIISGRKSDVVERRARELGIQMVFQGQRDKVVALSQIIEDKGISEEHIAFIGDDIIDIPVMKRVGFAASVGDAVQEVKEVAHYVSGKPGGRGAVRDVIEYILRSGGLWEGVTGKYFE